jgi:capsular exopolysaccharide synthesis family protein
MGDFGNVMSPTFLLWVLKQWWKIAIPVGLVLAALAGAIVLYSFVPKYEANALMMIEDTRTSIAFDDRGARTGSHRYVQTQLELLRSRVVLAPLLSRPEIANASELSREMDRVGYLRRKLAVKREGGSELYNISYISASPQFAADLVNAVIEEYMNRQTDDETLRTQAVIEILEKERKKREIEVQRLRGRVVDLAKDVTGKDPFGGHITKMDNAGTPASALFSSIVASEVEQEVLRAQLEALESVGDTADPLESSGLLDMKIDQQPEVLERYRAIQAVRAQQEQIKERYTQWASKQNSWESDSTYIGLQRRVDRLEKEFTEAREKARTLILAMRKEERNYAREQERAKLTMQLTVLETRRKSLADRYASQVGDLQTGGGQSVELEFARAELAREDKVFELIASRKIALQTEMSAPARVKLEQKASVPSVPIEQTPYKLLFLACSAAFVLPLAAAVAREVTVRRINDVVQLCQESKLRVLGEISTLPVRYVAASPGKLLPSLRRAAYIFAESINSLRTNLAMAPDFTGRQIVAVTSSVSGEGKTSVATSLAMSIADTTGADTLIIDGDMRSPDVATMLKTPNRPGLFEYLSDKCSLDEAIHRVGDGNLYTMPAGRPTKNPHLVLKLAETKRLFDQLRERFPSIIVDTPPILGASESLILAKAADIAIFCSLCDVSRATQVHLAVARLEHAGVNVAGAVLSGIHATRYASIYGYYANRADGPA